MAKSLVLAGLKLPVEIVTQRKTIVAKNRVGKSNTGCVYVERVHDLDLGIQTLVLDPKGDWWGIKSSADGKEKGLPFTIFGGDHADIPINAHSGKLVAEYLANNNVSAVIDLSEMSKGDLCRFAADFLQAIYKLWRKNRTPMNLILEEADDFAPQAIEKWIGPEQARCLSMVIQIAKKAGFLGIGLLCITQRCASLNKNVLTQSDIMFFMRTTSPQDIKAADEWLKNQDQAKREEVLKNISSLQNGEAYVFAPELGIFQRIQLPRRSTYDSGYTPKVGEKRVEPKVMAEVDIERLSKQFAELIEKTKADDPAVLKAEIRNLQKSLAAQEKAAVKEVIEKEVVVEKQVPFVPPQVGHGIEDVLERLQQALDSGRKALAMTKEVPQVWMSTAIRSRPERLLSQGAVDRQAKNRLTASKAPLIQARAHNVSGEVSGPQQRILDSLAWLGSIGIEQADKVQLALLADASPSSSAYANNLGVLRTGGYIDYPAGGIVALTKEGQKVANAPDRPPTVEDLHRTLESKLSGPQWRIVQALIQAFPESMAKESLAEAAEASATSSAFANNLGTLRSLGLIDYPKGGFVIAKPVLFLEA